MYNLNGKGKGWSAGKEYVARSVCKICGEMFYVAPCIKKRSKNSGLYCSKKCRGVSMLKPKKEKIIKLKNEIKLNSCKLCGAEAVSLFCNQTCYTEYRKINSISKNVTKCKNCSTEYIRTNHEVSNDKHHFCSISCSKQFYNKNMNQNCYTHSVGGKREDLNNRYFRSRWEANYARYLNFLINNNQILRWEYEPDTFVFESIKRGTRSYLPDFKVYKTELEYEYHEVKGYNGPTSQTKLKRMAKYFPSEKLILIDKDRYMAIHRQMKSIIPYWEIDVKKAHLYK